MKASQTDLIEYLDGMKAAEDAANRAETGWSDRALAALIEYGKTVDGFTIEMLRERSGVDSPTDQRAWGGVVKRAARLGIIRRIGFVPAKSSNGSAKPFWTLCEVSP